MTKILVNTNNLNKDLSSYLDKALDRLNKSYELSTKLVTPPDYPFIDEIELLKRTIESIKRLVNDYNNSYKIASNHFDELNDNLLLDIKSINFKDDIYIKLDKNFMGDVEYNLKTNKFEFKNAECGIFAGKHYNLSKIVFRKIICYNIPTYLGDKKEYEK